MKREHKGWQVEVTSYPSGHKWRPIVIVSNETVGRREITNLRTPTDWLFNTKQESDDQGHHLGSTWIERHGFSSDGAAKGSSMWAGIVYGTLLERHGNRILLSGGAQICLDEAVPCDLPVGTYLKVTYAEINGRKVARSISQSDSFHALDHSLKWRRQ